MLEITGRVVVDRSGTPVPGVVVEAFGLSRGVPKAASALAKSDASWVTAQPSAGFPDTAPNDNFDKYRLRLSSRAAVSTSSATSRAGSSHPSARPGSSDPNVHIHRGTGCAYYFLLEVWDKTVLNDDTATHYAWSIWPSASRTT